MGFLHESTGSVIHPGTLRVFTDIHKTMILPTYSFRPTFDPVRSSVRPKGSHTRSFPRLPPTTALHGPSSSWWWRRVISVHSSLPVDFRHSGWVQGVGTVPYRVWESEDDRLSTLSVDLGSVRHESYVLTGSGVLKGGLCLWIHSAVWWGPNRTLCIRESSVWVPSSCGLSS